MLVLSRHANETVKIGDDISVTVIDVKGDNVKLGFEAPKDVPIIRTELLERKDPHPDRRFHGDGLGR